VYRLTGICASNAKHLQGNPTEIDFNILFSGLNTTLKLTLRNIKETVNYVIYETSLVPLPNP